MVVVSHRGCDFIALVANNAEHLSKCLLATHISSLKKLLKSYAHLKNWIVFLLFSCKSSLSVLDIRPLSDK